MEKNVLIQQLPSPIDREGAAPQPAAPDHAAIERPAGLVKPAAMFGSDAIADAIAALGIPYIAINPGASYRGLHDSLVNYLGNKCPQILLCLHEDRPFVVQERLFRQKINGSHNPFCSIM